MSVPPASPGIYVVSLTNEHPISVNADRLKIAERCISVNRNNCKYGRAVNLARRKSDYQKTFGVENVVFTVVAVTSHFEAIEAEAGNRLGAFRIRGRTGKPNEWLQGISVAEVERILHGIIRDLGAPSTSAPPDSSAKQIPSKKLRTPPLPQSPHAPDVQPEDVVAAATYLNRAGMSLEHLRDLHHSPARTESYSATIRYFSNVGVLRDRNQMYGARLLHVAVRHQQSIVTFPSLVSEALVKYPK